VCVALRRGDTALAEPCVFFRTVLGTPLAHDLGPLTDTFESH